jgi:hypothetical protein
MKPLYPSLVFPDTDIFSYRQFPLFLFGSPVIVLEPVVPESEEQIRDRDMFIKSGLCQIHNPAPLGEDRERFLRLIEDIGNRKDDYAAQLSALTVAAMSASDAETSGEKRYQIVSSMLGKPAASLKDESKPQLELWQSRLVLAISEILKKEEEELRQELQLLDAQEMEMFKSLQGDAAPDESDPFSEVQRISAQLKSARPRAMKMRFRSWLSLMRAGTMPTTSLLLASSVDAGDQLVIEYEKRHDGSVRPILELNLPERIEAGPVHVISQIQRFHEQSLEVRKAIYSDLDALITRDFPSSDSADMLLPTGPDYLSSWNELVDNHFPQGSHGAASLLFYLLPNGPVAELLNLQPDSAAPSPAHGLFAVLKH